MFGHRTNAASRRRKPRSRAQTLLELVGATTVIAIALVPALRLMRDSVRAVGDLETSSLLATFCASKLEEQLQQTAAHWVAGVSSGDYASTGYPACRFSATRSDAIADGGIPGSLMAISVIAWEDRNSNEQWDARELRVVFGSKMARTVAYEHEANGS